jgi:ATP-dependent helicase/nuclease subunit A
MTTSESAERMIAHAPSVSSPAPPAPRESVLAAAGAGKTFHISSRIIALLAHGAPPESILASTFTRKAAGQILERVLERMARAALSDEEARDLSAHASLSKQTPLAGDRAFWRARLGALVRAIHRTNVGTLDAFFMGIARAFAGDLGLPTAWSVADEPTIAQTRSEALQDVLAREDLDALVRLLSYVFKGESNRAIHDHLASLMDKLLSIHEQLDPSIPNPWGAFREQGTRPPPTDEELAALADRILAMTLPTTKAGTPRANWLKARDKTATALRSRDWESLVESGFCNKVMEGASEFDRATIADDVCALVEAALDLARRDLRPRFAAQVEAFGLLTDLFVAAYRERQAQTGTYRFDDVTRLIGGGDVPLGARSDLFFRLDAKIHHLLLDEFQDTSLPQWQALAPLAEEVLSDPGGRAAIVVADPKQSIYGWRGGEPEIVREVTQHFHLEERSLSVSWRSAPVVLDFVNRVFEGIALRPTILEKPAWAEPAERWQRDFKRHEAAKPNRDLPGFVEVVGGPRESGRGNGAEPALCRFAARRVADLHRAMPEASIAVLTRKNATVARMIVELKQLGVQASEEGGTALFDSAACEAILALLHLADHPADGIVRYHVARSPLGAALGFTDPADRPAAARLAARSRSLLAEEGYGPTVERWIEMIHASCDTRELRRLSRLAELAHRYDERATLRPTDFVRFVESQRAEDPASAPVRVMTVHQAKGLEFDVVVVPELDGELATAGRLPFLPFRFPPTARIKEVMPCPPGPLKKLFPEVMRADAQDQASSLRDGLSTLYVALTRASHALHVILRSDDDGGLKDAKTSARLLRESLDGGTEILADGDVLFRAGDPDWYDRLNRHREEAPPAPLIDPTSITLPAPTRPSRLLPRRSPSSLEGGGTVAIADVLRLDDGPALARGSVMHAWFEQIEWLDDGPPDEHALRRIARSIDPDMPEATLDALLAQFDAALGHDATRSLLNRSSYPDGTRVLREHPFIHRENGFIVEGIIDRLVLIPDGKYPARAEIIDFKTDAVVDQKDLDSRVAFYRPQLMAYARAVGSTFRLPPDRVVARLLFAASGATVALDPSA